MKPIKTKTGIACLEAVAARLVNNLEGVSHLSLRDNKKRGKMLSLLQKAQSKGGYLSEDAMLEVASQTGVSINEVYGVASFYAQFRFTPPGKHIIKVCSGTACHVRGVEDLLKSLEMELDVHPGGTTQDEMFSLERVACLGCCSLAPAMVIDNNIYGRMNATKAKKILAKYLQPKPHVEILRPIIETNANWRWTSYGPIYALKPHPINPDSDHRKNRKV